jgi:acyl dehydratase
MSDAPPLDYAFEDLAPGLTLEFGPVVVEREAILAFARAYDFQPFHVDEAAAENSFAGGLIASGWHTCALTMRLLYDGFVRRSTSMGSPGIAELRWVRPVRPGDALSARLTIAEARASASRPDRGLARCLVEVRAGGAVAMTQDFIVFFARRGARPEPRPLASEPAAAPAAAGSAEPAAAGGPMPYLEDLVPGTVETFAPYRFTAEDIVAFAQTFDPQPFHVDEAAARASHFGGLCASGWQTAAVWMRQMLLARGDRRGGARTGPSPGFRDMRWLRPVYAGDSITFDATLTAARPSASRPGWGIAFHHNTGRNQRGETVFTFEGAALWERRPG